MHANVFDWIRNQLKPRAATSDEAVYERMESQSGYCLPIIYQPFQIDLRWHWNERGAIHDYSLSVGDGDLLDVGPGDGWPSLLVAPYARSVTGVDASRKRVEVCTANAARLGITNFRGAYVEAGRALPFPDAHFDGVMAASSVEQTPDPKAMLREIYRVLKPGGRFRMHYESLQSYRGGGEQEVWAWPVGEAATGLSLIDRRLNDEAADYYTLVLDRTPAELERLAGGPVTFAALTPALLDSVRGSIRDALVYSLAHPGCRTLMAWLREIGFRVRRATHWGGTYASRLFDRIEPAERPSDLAALDRLLRPAVAVACDLDAPVEGDPPILVTK